jgi:NADH-quinone oxidoreductase subunit J
MDISPFFFYLFAGMGLAFSLMVILKKSPVASAFSLIMVFFSFAAIYAMLGAHFIAAIQILVYAGAIMVLFVFVIMLLNPELRSFDLGRTSKAIPIVISVVTLGFLALVTWVFKNSDFSGAGVRGVFSEEIVEAAGGNTRVFSELLFSEYTLPFQMIGLLLTAVVVGVVAIAMRNKKIPESTKESS